MSYVILGTCINDGACVDACPVSAIHPAPGEAGYLGADQLYIDPSLCVSCNACAEICPVQAILPETRLDPALVRYASINADFFKLIARTSA